LGGIVERAPEIVKIDVSKNLLFLSFLLIVVIMDVLSTENARAKPKLNKKTV